jgi:hypothetical protein
VFAAIYTNMFSCYSITGFTLVRVALAKDAVIGIFANYMTIGIGNRLVIDYKSVTLHSCQSGIRVVNEHYFTVQHLIIFYRMHAIMYNANHLYQFAYVLEDTSKLTSRKLSRIAYKPHDIIIISQVIWVNTNQTICYYNNSICL